MTQKLKIEKQVNANNPINRIEGLDPKMTNYKTIKQEPKTNFIPKK